MIQPLFFLALFAPLLADVPGLGDGSAQSSAPVVSPSCQPQLSAPVVSPSCQPQLSARQWFVPGIVVMSCLFGTSMTGSNLSYEMQTGSHERLLVTPLRRSALLIGRALKEMVPMLVQVVIIVAAVTPFGFTLHPVGVLAGLLLLSVFCVSLGALSYSLALAAKNQDWIFWTVQPTLLFPLLLAGELLPIDGAPGWLRTMAAFNPLIHVVDAERTLFSGDVVTTDLAQGAAAAVVVAVVGVWVGTKAMRSSA